MERTARPTQEAERMASLDTSALGRHPTAGWRALVGDLPTRLRRRLSGGTYRPEIDGLRFVAIAMVVTGHFMERAVRFFPQARLQVEDGGLLALFKRPGMGVFLFFAISGFIIGRQALKAKASPLSARFLRAYFGRRVLRIEPPYLLFLCATWLFVTASGYAPKLTTYFNGEPQSLTTSLAGSLVYLHDLVWGTYPRLFPPGWSLEVEVQFYLFAPLLFFAYFKAPRGSVRVALGLAGLAGGALLSLLAPKTIGPVHVDASILRFFHFFWLGILIADGQDWLTAKTASWSAPWAGLVGWGGLVCYFALPNAPETITPDNLGLALLDRAAAYVTLAALFVSAFAATSSFRRFCARPWISLIGGACYSLYLVHLQAIEVMTGLAAKLVPGAALGPVVVLGALEMVVVIGAGLTFYVVLERPFMRPDWPLRVWRWIGPAAAHPVVQKR